MSKNAASKAKLLERMLVSKEFRYAYVESALNEKIATLIRVIREKQGYKAQGELAAAMGKHQTHISRLENLDYGSYSLASLKEICRTFEMALNVSIEPFSEFLRNLEDVKTDSISATKFGDREECSALKDWAEAKAKTAPRVPIEPIMRMPQVVEIAALRPAITVRSSATEFVLTGTE